MLNIALAASGAGHVRRGIETWIEELHRRLAGRCRAVLFQGGGTKTEGERVLPCLRRDARMWGGVSSPIPWTARMYAERASFAPGLIAHLKGFDVLHTADPFLAALAAYAGKIGYWKGETLLSYQGPGPVWRLYANRVGHVQFLDRSYLEGPGALIRKRDRVHVIPNFVDTEVFRPGDPAAARRVLEIDAAGPLIVSVGAITAMKGIDFLARGVERLRKEAGVPAELLLVGQKQSGSAGIVARARSRLGAALHVRTNLPYRLMPEVYRAADAFALCSPFEPFGIAFIEALASGVPVLGNRVFPTVSIIGDGGLTADVRSPARTATALERLLAPDARETFGVPGRRRAVETYSAPVVVGRILELYAELAGGG